MHRRDPALVWVIVSLEPHKALVYKYPAAAIWQVPQCQRDPTQDDTGRWPGYCHTGLRSLCRRGGGWPGSCNGKQFRNGNIQLFDISISQPGPSGVCLHIHPHELNITVDIASIKGSRYNAPEAKCFVSWSKKDLSAWKYLNVRERTYRIVCKQGRYKIKYSAVFINSVLTMLVQLWFSVRPYGDLSQLWLETFLTL